MQKELDRYLLPVSRKKYKTERRCKKIHQSDCVMKIIVYNL